MKNSLFNKLIKIKYVGLNWNTFQSMVINNNIVMHNIIKKSYNDITFSLYKKDYYKITKNPYFKNYKLEILDVQKAGSFLKDIVSRIGVVVGVMISFLACISFSRLTLHFSMSGLHNVNRSSVENALFEYGIRLGKVNNFNNGDLENYLLQNVEGLSLVSVMKKGTTICLNFKEKDVFFDEIETKLISPYNMIINEINISSGKTCCKEGDVVTSGKVLIDSYSFNENKGVNKVVGSVKGTAWWVGSCVLNKKQEILVRTGKKQVCRSVSLGKIMLSSKVKKPVFEEYKIASSEKVFAGIFLPFKVNTITYYECEKIVVEQNLDENKEICLQDSRLMAYNKVPSNITDIREEQKIVDMGQYYVFNTYLTAEVEVKSAN